MNKHMEMSSMSSKIGDYDPKTYKVKNDRSEQFLVKQIEKDLNKLKENMLQEEMQRDRREAPITAED